MASSEYPRGLSLQSAHVFFRHGARTPTAPVFVKEHDLPMYWPLCTAARKMSTAILSVDNRDTHNTLQWRRVLETIRPDDGPSTSSSDLCNHGELTDHGRSSMLALGRNLRHLYIDQLKLLPPVLANPNDVYFRSSPFPRALESLHHVLWGFCPPHTRAPSFGTPQIVMRSPQEETLLPNEDYCARFTQICKAYTRRTAERWNTSVEMEYLNTHLRKHMPGRNRVAVDSTPTMHALHDIISATAASESRDIRLPEEFYDPRVRDIVDQIAFEEEYSAYEESNEMRRVGIGALLGDVVERLVLNVERRLDSKQAVVATGTLTEPGKTRMFLSGSHDSTIAAILASLGAVDHSTARKWPPYGSVVAIELFSDDTAASKPNGTGIGLIGRTPMGLLTGEQKERLQGQYVRVRYNGGSLVVPGCRQPGRNWQGNESFCTLAAFKEIVDRFTPENWKQACVTNLDKSGLPEKIESAGGC